MFVSYGYQIINLQFPNSLSNPDYALELRDER